MYYKSCHWYTLLFKSMYKFQLLINLKKKLKFSKKKEKNALQNELYNLG